MTYPRSRETPIPVVTEGLGLPTPSTMDGIPGGPRRDGRETKGRRVLKSRGFLIVGSERTYGGPSSFLVLSKSGCGSLRPLSTLTHFGTTPVRSIPPRDSGPRNPGGHSVSQGRWEEQRRTARRSGGRGDGGRDRCVPFGSDVGLPVTTYVSNGSQGSLRPHRPVFAGGPVGVRSGSQGRGMEPVGRRCGNDEGTNRTGGRSGGEVQEE